MKTFSVEQIYKTLNLDANLIVPHYKLDVMSRFMEIKSINGKFKHKQIEPNWVFPIVF